jgi:hypothetical protein
MDINVLLEDEISIILLWFGLHGILDQFINLSKVFPFRNYIYMLFILVGFYLNLN